MSAEINFDEQFNFNVLWKFVRTQRAMKLKCLSHGIGARCGTNFHSLFGNVTANYHPR